MNVFLYISGTPPPLILILFSVFFSQVHMLHLVPQWQSAERHRKLKVMMQVGVLFFYVLHVLTDHIEIVQ